MINLTKTKFLITGSAGFIGFHLAKYILLKGHKVIGLDGFTDYYDINLKKSRNDILKKFNNYFSFECMLENHNLLLKICSQEKPDIIIHLAAQAGVRYSIDNPRSYLESNLVGSFNILEIAKETKVKHLLIASTSSVYGNSDNTPYHENEKTDKPLSFYAATKKSTEILSHSYAYSFKIPITIFRFFTVYGPWGRPDMALFKFTKAILSNKPIDVYNNGDMKRDFTYIDDLVKSIYLLQKVIPPQPNIFKNEINGDSLSKDASHRIVNIGNSKTVNLLDFIETIENILGKRALKNYKEMQLGDVKTTHSNNNLLDKITNFHPNTDIKFGIKKFIEWYIEYYLKK